MELRFDQLSGGEREIAFLIGQIDRFGLRNGLFLLDEPELHLNPDLVRAWVTYLVKTVATGQVWLATHSLEAVEAAGLSSTLLLERDPNTKLVSHVGSLSDQRILSALSRAVGTPAFSITGLRFVFIEGEEAIGERERYRRVTGLSTDTRFIECGSCSEVIRRLAATKHLAQEAGQAIRVAGVIDSDWRDQNELSQLAKQNGLIALPVHEVENFFLEKHTLERIAGQNGRTDFDYASSLKALCDNRAGGWIVQSALSDESSSDISELPAEARRLAFGLNWEKIGTDIDLFVSYVANLSGFDEKLKNRLGSRLQTFAKLYERKRETDELWKICEGKEILKSMARRLGFADHHGLERAVTACWDADPTRLPAEVMQLRQHLMAI